MMEPRDWFAIAHTPVEFGWFPVPSTVDVAIDQFYEALQKRRALAHDEYVEEDFIDGSGCLFCVEACVRYL
jgi:hypothetical protein